MKFEPKTDEQIDKENMLPVGVYDFEVIQAKDGMSNSGNEKIELKLLVFAQNGVERTIFDVITPAFAKKFKHFCDTTGMLDKYEAGNLTSMDCLHKSGKAQIEFQEERFDQEKQKTYKARNIIGDYIKKGIDVKTASEQDDPDQIAF